MAPRRKQAPQPAAQRYHMPAPIGGLNSVAAGLEMPPGNAYEALNLISARNGLRSRLGYREHCTSLAGVASDEVRTVLPFAGANTTKVFATTDQGIYDVTASSTSPTLVLAFGSTGGVAGWGSCAVMVTAAGHFLLYCDELNGLHVYVESTDTWAAVTQGGGATQISNVNPANLTHVTVFKQRVWFCERDTSSAWYLATGAVYGAATAFPMGRQLRNGGTLVGLWNWTYDGGAGMDDSLVAIATGGDVAIYQGTDPATADAFGLKGVWFINKPPAGRTVASSFGGDLLILTRQGIIPISRLVVGATSTTDYQTANVSNLFNEYMLSRADTRGWAMALHPEDNAIMVVIPTGSAENDEQLVQAVASRGWFKYRGLPIVSAAPSAGKLYFGTDDGRVCVNDGYVDNVLLADGSSTPVDWSLLTAFSELGLPGQMKHVNGIRAIITTDVGAASYSVAPRYDFDVDAIDDVEEATLTGALYDTGVYDTDVYGGGVSVSDEWRGATGGPGWAVAVAVRGTANTVTVYVGADVRFTVGSDY